MAEQEIPDIVRDFDKGVSTLEEIAAKFSPSQWTGVATTWANSHSIDPVAQCIIGINYSRVGNHKDAIEQLELAANQDNANGMYWLAKAYQAGKGVSPNVEMAIRLIQQSAKKGHAGAQFELGLLIENPSIALNYFKKAADQGHTLAKEKLATPEMRKIASNKNIVNAFSKGSSRRRTRRKHNKKRTLRKRHNKRRI